MGHTKWAKLKVRHMLQRGWEVWLAPTRATLWAKPWDGEGPLQVRYMAPDELEVVDEVLREIREENE